MKMLVLVKENKNILAYHLTQNIVIENYIFFEKEVSEILKEEKFRIILDVTNVDYIVSQGAGTIIRWFKKNRDNGGNLILCNGGDRFKRIIKILGVDKMISFEDDIEAALEKFDIL